jgi:uncharacterized protein
MTFVDTGAWFATFVPFDRRHVEANRWFQRNTSPLVTTDYIIDETLTLMRARGERDRAIAVADAFFAGELATIHYLTQDEIRAAWDVFQKYDDKDWSFTDCTSKVVMETLGIATAFAFDHHFRQFGAFAIVP